MARYEFVEGSSSKFWEITLAGESFTVVFGRIGSAGQSQSKSFPSAAAAKAEHDKLVREKTKKGYLLVGADPPAEATDAAAPTGEAPTAEAPAAAPKLPSPRTPRAPPPPPPPSDGWIDAGGGYALSVIDGKIACRNDKGKILASVPRAVKEGEPFQALADALELLEAHEAECREQVESWMLRSLPVPAAVLAAAWPDPAWRAQLENAVVLGEGGAGLLRGVGPKGLGLVTLDGDTTWLAEPTVRIPHPMLLEELDDWRGLCAETGLSQGLAQLFRETFPRAVAKPEEQTIEQWARAEFAMLAQAMNAARKGGWRVKGGAAACAIHEGGRVVEARYDLGEGDPLTETVTGSLYWVDEEGETLRLAEVGPIAWSEGMRMAATIYKKRKVEEKEDGDDA